MKTVLIPVSGLSLVAGVVWHPFASNKPFVEMRKRALGTVAKSYARLGTKNAEGSYYGLINDKGSKRSNVYALASVLFKKVPQGAAAVVIKHESFYCVCCINNGSPVLDHVFSNITDVVRELEPITKLLQITPSANFENTYGFHHVEGLEAKLLGPKKSRAKALAEVPSSPVKFVVFSLLILGAGFWYIQAQNSEKERVEAARLKAQRDADPVPKYMRNLMLEEPKVAMPDASVYSMLSRLAEIDIEPDGWKLEMVKCGNYQCSLEYQRNMGMYLELPMPKGFKLQFKSPVDLNKATLIGEFNTANFKMPQYEKNYDEFINSDFGNRGQMWLTAGIGISMDKPQLWPKTTGVPPTFKHPMAVEAGHIKITNIPIPLFTDLIETKPKNVHVSTFLIKPIIKNGEPELNVDVEAFYHVKQ